MSLFDYHGRFRGSNKSHDDSADSAEDLLSAPEPALKAEQDDPESDISQDKQDTNAHNTNEIEADKDQDTDSSNSNKEAKTDNTATESESAADKPEHADGAEDASENENVAGQEDINASTNTDEQDESTEGIKDADTSDSAEELDKSTPENKHAKKKKTKASKGKHVAGANNAESNISSQETTNEKSIELPTTKRSRGILKGIGITACILLAILALTYGAGVVVFMNRILPNTLLGNHDISLRTNEETIQLLESIENNYTIEVKTGTFSYSASKADIGLELNASRIVEAIHKKYDAFLWPLYIFNANHDISDELDISFDPERYEAEFTKAIEDYNKEAAPPVDAYIYYDEKTKRYLIMDEIMGTQIDPTLALEALNQAISELQPVLRLTAAEMYQPKTRSNDESVIETAKLATSLVSAQISLTVNDAVVREIKPSELSKCIHVDEKAQVAFDEKALDEFCNTIVQEFNTVGSERTYTRPDGKVVTVSGGIYGWSVDDRALKEALLDAIKQADPVNIVVPFETTADVYVAPGQRDWGNRYIDIDLSEQHVRFYDENGILFWETDCITGSPDGVHNTPQGVWKINDMESPSKLIGYENGKKIYESHVTYWMPFIRNSIGLHDATWQPSFGGSMFANGYGSHGCVNISYRAAQELWGLLRVGDVVVTHF